MKQWSYMAIKIILLALVLMVSCKKDHVCREKATKIGQGFIFKLFNKADIDTIILYTFTHDSTFSHLLDSAVVIDTAIRLDSATKRLFASSNVSGIFFGIDDSVDLEVYLPAVGKRYQIHASYGPDEYMETNDCRSRHPLQRLNSISIVKNGVPASLETSADSYYAYLKP